MSDSEAPPEGSAATPNLSRTQSTVTRRQFIVSGARLLADGSVLVLLAKPISALAAKGEGRPLTTGPYAFLVDAARCIGCGSCVRACRAENGVSPGNFRTWIERYTVTRDGGIAVDSPAGGEPGFGAPPAVKGEVAQSYFVPKLCNHCRRPPCAQVCPVGATFSTHDGVVLVDQKQCVGCGYCVQACPYGARFIDPRTHVADKCTWCVHRLRAGQPPACVAACPVGARTFGPIRDTQSPIAKRLREKRLAVLKADLGTEPAVYYEGIAKEVR